MPRVAVITDSNSGITQMDAKNMGIDVVPMPFTIDDKTYYEDINLTIRKSLPASRLPPI